MKIFPLIILLIMLNGIYSIRIITIVLLIALLYYGYNYILTVVLCSLDENCEIQPLVGERKKNVVKDGPLENL